MAPKKPKRDPEVKKKFLKQKGLTKVPPGKEIDHKKPLEDGGKDTPGNMQLFPKKKHAEKTAREAAARAKKKK